MGVWSSVIGLVFCLLGWCFEDKFDAREVFDDAERVLTKNNERIAIELEFSRINSFILQELEE